MVQTPGISSSTLESNNLVTAGDTLIQHHLHAVPTLPIQGHAKEGGLKILQHAVAPGASHDSVERFYPPRCYPNTRTAVLERILEWATGKDLNPKMREAFVMWLYGPAGAGKSAIAQTISELLKEAGVLLASFFFSRSDLARNNERSLVASIVYQAILHLPPARSPIIDLIEGDPLIFTRSLDTQFTTLLFKPLQALVENGTIKGSPLLIVIDGLDECIDPKAQASILDGLCTSQRQRYHPLPLCVLIASRPEPEISLAFNSEFKDLTRLALDNTYHPKRDIFSFLRDKFVEITRTHPHYTTIPPGWPGEDVIDSLVEKSSGQLIYASRVVKYISSVQHQPVERLEVVLGLHPVQRHIPFAELDALYSYILSSVADIDIILKILGLVILGIEMTTHTIEVILGLKDGDVPIFLSTLPSLVHCVPRSTLVTTADLSVEIFHTSLKDFLLDELRSKNMCIKPGVRHAEYAHLGFKYIEDGSLRSFSISRDILRSMLHHLKYASQTSQLQDDITKFDVGRLQELFDEQGWSDVGDVIDFWCELINVLHTSLWNNANDLYKAHKDTFDQFLMDNLEEYYAEPFLTFALTMIYVNPKPIMALPLISEEMEDIDKSGLRILWHFQKGGKAPFESPYLVMLREFLSDLSCCGANMVTGSRYYSAAEICLDSQWRSRIGQTKTPLPGSHYVERFLEKSASTSPQIFLDFVSELHRGGYLTWRGLSPLDNIIGRLILDLSPTDWQGHPDLKNTISNWSSDEWEGYPDFEDGLVIS